MDVVVGDWTVNSRATRQVVVLLQDRISMITIRNKRGSVHAQFSVPGYGGDSSFVQTLAQGESVSVRGTAAAVELAEGDAASGVYEVQVPPA